MPMTVVVTRNASGRVRGFLASVMCEIAPGVYTGPRMSAGVRKRVWQVLESWCAERVESVGVVMTWPDSKLPGGQAVQTLGSPHQDLVDAWGVYLARSDLTKAERDQLDTPDPEVPF